VSTPATILIVDDEVKNRRLLDVLLTSEGYVTICAADGAEALGAVLDEKVDLILLDVMMPGMSGYVVAETLKANALTATIPIIMLTASVDRETRIAALAAGVEEFLSKPFDRAELSLRVRNLLRLKEYADFQAHYSATLELKVAERSADLQRFRLAMDATPDAIILFNSSSMKFIEVNATASSMLGYSRDQLMGMTAQQLYSAPDGVIEAGFAAIIAGSSAAMVSCVQLQRKDGTFLPVEVHSHAHLSSEDWIIVSVLRDVTERSAADERLQRMAHYDSLTGLPNRALFHETLRKTTLLAVEKKWSIAVMFLDVDHFKTINDTMGHAAGDDLLGQVAERLVHCVSIRDTVGRVGGDEFALLILSDDRQDAAASVAREIRAALLEPFSILGQDVTVTSSIGITVCPDDADDSETLMRYADTAMYRAKQAGGDTFRFFTAKMNSDLVARMELERALREAVTERQFVLHYQPKVHLSTGRIAGVEGLLRWERPGYGLVPPKDFVPILESTGLIREVGGWVINEAARQVAEWMKTDVGAMRIAVNVSARQFVEGDLDGVVREALHTHAIPAELLELELTETSLMADTERTIATLHKLKGRGVQLSIDDFGTGYSCLAYLRQFPIDKLKIDVAFVRHVTENADEAAITATIIQMARSLNLEVIAEGVETAGQLAYLLRQGCDQVQGFLISRPLPAVELAGIMRARTLLPPGSPATVDSRTTILLVSAYPVSLAALESVLQPEGYRVLTAASVQQGLVTLALQDVHVILCDQSPSLDGADFFNKARTLRPEPLRIMLADDDGDAAAVTRSVNHGGIFASYPKPWSDEVLREQIREALRHYRVQRETLLLPSPDLGSQSRRRPGSARAAATRVATGRSHRLDRSARGHAPRRPG
jgi:diguanylate cyclase (GGDEF)-like protein/PAS domain S-box-containing protein